MTVKQLIFQLSSYPGDLPITTYLPGKRLKRGRHALYVVYRHCDLAGKQDEIIIILEEAINYGKN